MLEKERHNLILKLVEERSIVSVGDLLDLLGASEATIRRDINALAEQWRGEAHPRRRRGGASAASAASGRHAVRDEPGRQRAAEARDRPRGGGAHRAGRSIIINGGTTTFALVEFLENSRSRHPHQFVSDRREAVRHQPQPHHAAGRHDLPRAEHHPSRRSRTTPSRTSGATSCSWAATGSNRFGMMEADPLIVQAQTKLLKRSEHVIVMADSSKLRRKSAMIVRASTASTPSSPTTAPRPRSSRTSSSAGIKVIVAKVTEEDELKKLA